MQFEIYRDNGGQFHWCLAGEDATRLAVSATASAPHRTRAAPQPMCACTPVPPAAPRRAE
jgi:hypothetical protein